MWILILERLIFYRTSLSRMMKDAFRRWEGRSERKSWHAHQVRLAMVSEVRMAANQGLPMIQTLVALCPCSDCSAPSPV